MTRWHIRCLLIGVKGLKGAERGRAPNFENGFKGEFSKDSHFHELTKCPASYRSENMKAIQRTIINCVTILVLYLAYWLVGWFPKPQNLTHWPFLLCALCFHVIFILDGVFDFWDNSKQNVKGFKAVCMYVSHNDISDMVIFDSMVLSPEFQR